MDAHKGFIQQIQPLQPGGGAHEIAVVKGEHHRIAALGIENAGQMALHAPVQAVAALQEKARLVGKGYVYMVVLGNFQTV